MLAACSWPAQLEFALDFVGREIYCRSASSLCEWNGDRPCIYNEEKHSCRGDAALRRHKAALYSRSAFGRGPIISVMNSKDGTHLPVLPCTYPSSLAPTRPPLKLKPQSLTEAAYLRNQPWRESWAAFSTCWSARNPMSSAICYAREGLLTTSGGLIFVSRPWYRASPVRLLSGKKPRRGGQDFRGGAVTQRRATKHPTRASVAARLHPTP